MKRPGPPVYALVVALAALVAGATASIVAAIVRDGVTTAPAHRGGLTGVALHGTPAVITFTGTLAQDLTAAIGVLLIARSGAALGLRPARWGRALWMVPAGYVLFLLISGAWLSALDLKDHESIPIDLATRDSAVALVGSAFLVCVVAPVCEELFFRGYVFGSLRRYGLVPAALVTGLAFGGVHVVSSPAGFIVPLAALGVILCLVREWTGSLLPAMALHAVNNSIAFGAGDGRLWLVPVYLAAAALAIGLIGRRQHLGSAPCAAPSLS